MPDSFEQFPDTGSPHMPVDNKDIPSNGLGIQGYSSPKNIEFLKTSVDNHTMTQILQEFCKQHTLNPKELIQKVTFGSEEEEAQEALVSSIIFTLHRMGYKQQGPADLKFVSPGGNILTPDQNTALAERYDNSHQTVYVANGNFFSPDIRNFLLRRYNIPLDASIDYVRSYLTAHSTVHYVQHKQNRITDNEILDGRDLSDDSNVIEYLKHPDEKEAHNIAIEVVDDIWEKIQTTHDTNP